MTDIEILNIVKNALYEIELDVKKAEYTNDIYDVEIDISKAINYINARIKTEERGV